ncbi:MAG: hypothetical protein JXR70_19215, partial [Spirochaetales bacterium]|nr:hypothetical protein [Spirochaetales bacterium]
NRKGDFANRKFLTLNNIRNYLNSLRNVGFAKQIKLSYYFKTIYRFKNSCFTHKAFEQIGLSKATWDS